MWRCCDDYQPMIRRSVFNTAQLRRSDVINSLVILLYIVLTTDPVHGTCTDAGGTTDCSAWQAAGECVHNPAYMFSHCALSCQSTCLCSQFVPAGKTADRNCFCGYWATLGHCTTNPTIRDVHCQSSCNLVATVDCGQPPDVFGADKIVSSTAWGGNATYTCSAGYDQTGGNLGLRYCSDNGTWIKLWYGDGIDPVCTVRSCGEAPSVDAAQMISTGTNYQDSATYTCADSNAVMTGSGTATCQADGTWSATPTCTSQSTITNPVVVFITVPLLVLLSAGVILLGFYLYNVCANRRTPHNRINDVNSSQVSLVSHT